MLRVCQRCGEEKWITRAWVNSSVPKHCNKCNAKVNYFKGGTWTFRTQKGYMNVRLPSGRQVMQHRLVMESMIGRPLTRKETVHHINGDKSDNNPENLELWIRNHPTGVRAWDAPMADGAEDYFNLAA